MSDKLTQAQINVLINIESKYGFRFPELVKNQSGFSSEIPEKNWMPLIFKTIFVKIQVYENLAILSYEYTHPNGGSNGYIIETFRVEP